MEQEPPVERLEGSNSLDTGPQEKDGEVSSELLFAEYSSAVQSFPFGWQSTACVLWSMVFAVAKSNDNGMEVDKAVGLLDSVYTSEGVFAPVPASLGPGMFRALLTAGDYIADPRSTPLLYDADDWLSQSYILQSTASGAQQQKLGAKGQQPLISLQDLKVFEAQAVARRQMVRLLALSPADFPPKPGAHGCMSAVERGIKEVELMTFTSLSSGDLNRGNQLQCFQELVSAQTKPLPNFTGSTLQDADAGAGDSETITQRRFLRHLHALAFAGILSSEELTAPLALKKYYDLTDQLLYALHWPPPDRRNSRVAWSFPGGLTVDTATVMPAGRCVVKVQCITTAFPTACDSTAPPVPKGRSNSIKGKVDVSSLLTPTEANVGQAWLTAVIETAMLGVRMINHSGEMLDGNIHCSMFYVAEDEVRFTVFPGPKPELICKPDKQGTVCLLTTFPNSLAVTTCSNGDIKIATDSNSMAMEQYALFQEKHRLIGANMTVLRVFDCPANSNTAPHPFSHELLLLDGSRELFIDQSKIKHFLKRIKKQKPPVLFEFSLLEDMPADAIAVKLSTDGGVAYLSQDLLQLVVPQTMNLLERYEDATSKAIVDCYRDGRMAIQHADGKREVLFPDGTHMVHDPSTSMACVRRGSYRGCRSLPEDKPHLSCGWPTVEVDLDVDSTCRAHAMGMEVPINKGGERVRRRISLPNGTAVFVKYDTRVTARTNGSLKLVTRDRVCALATDDGMVSFKPSTAWADEDEQTFRHDCNLNGDTTSGSSSKAAGGIVETISTLANVGETLMSTAALLPARTSKSRATATTNVGTTTAAPTRQGRNTVGRSRRGGRSSSPPLTLGHQGNSPGAGFVPKPEADAIFVINLLNATCSLRDCEFNCFEVNLLSECKSSAEANGSMTDSLQAASPANSDPLAVTVTLAGEVAGLKPPAVARKPKAPRLFVVNRDGEAEEVLSVQDLALMEHANRWNADVSKVVCDAVSQPAEFGSRQLHYLTRKRLLSSHEDGVDFTAVFGDRALLAMDCPAAAVHLLNDRKYINSFAVQEKASLSAQHYSQISTAIQQCEAFRHQRLQSIDRFAVEDLRTAEQIEEEEAMVKRLKQAYKAAKLNAAKRKEQRAKDKADAEEEDDAVEAKDKGGGAFKPTKLSDAIAEGQEDDEEEGDDEDQRFSDDEDAPADPEEMEIRATFDDYAVDAGAAEGWASTPMMPLYMLQEALIRICNTFISNDLIEQAVMDSGEIEMSMEDITLHEFRGIFKCLQQLLKGTSSDSNLITVDDDHTVSSMGSAHSSPVKSYVAPQTAPDGEKRPIATAPRTAPMLNLSRLRPEEDERSTAAASQEDCAAGSAMNVVRKKVAVKSQ